MTRPGNNALIDQRVLVLAPTGRDASLTHAVLTQNGTCCEICDSMEQLCQRLREGVGAMILAQEAMDPISVHCLMNELEAQPKWSDPPVVLFATTRGGSDNVPAILGLLGSRANIAILERPVRQLTLLSAVRSALSARRRQYDVRDLLMRLEQAVQERDRFLAILSHELRNPLSTIRNALAISQQSGAGISREQLDIILRQTSQLSRLVDDLLDVSRVTAGKIILQQVPVNLVQVVQRSAESMQLAARAQQHHLALSLPAQSAFVNGDPVRLEQVVTNLLTNAIKYTPPGGQVGVTFTVEDNAAVIKVCDNGTGVAPEALPRLFDPFMQVDESLDRSQGGLGLGLTLVRSLVEMHRGTVTADSKGLGQGSEFTVRLPLMKTPAVFATHKARPATSTARRILVIEDNEDARTVMQRLLSLWGHQVEVAADGPDGVEKAIALRPDIVLVDIGLPGLSGYEVGAKLRPVLDPEVYLVALTGYGQPEDRKKTKQAGFDMHLVKPVEPEVLSQLLAEASVNLHARGA